MHAHMIRAAPSDPPLDASLSEETRVGVEALVRYEGKVFALFSFYYKTENTSPVIRCRRAARSIKVYTLRRNMRCKPQPTGTACTEHDARSSTRTRDANVHRKLASALPRLSVKLPQLVGRLGDGHTAKRAVITTSVAARLVLARSHVHPPPGCCPCAVNLMGCSHALARLAALAAAPPHSLRRCEG